MIVNSLVNGLDVIFIMDDIMIMWLVEDIGRNLVSFLIMVNIMVLIIDMEKIIFWFDYGIWIK